MITTVAELINELMNYPFHWKVELYADKNVDGLALLNLSGRAATIEKVIELPTP